MENNEVLVSGAGIAGCAVAYLLRQHGFTPVVVERAPAPRPGGQTVDLRGAGRTVIERMGLLDSVRTRTLDQRGIAWVDERGRRRAEIPVEAFGGKGIISDDEILRGDLSEVLHQGCVELGGIEFLFDDTVTAIEEGPGGVLVRFENAPPRRFALVVGADGLYSAVRRIAFGDTGLKPIGLLNAWFTMPAEVELDGWYLMHNAPGGRVASLRPGSNPNEQKAGLSVRVAPGVEGFDRRDPSSGRELLARSFAGVGWEAARLVRYARTAEDLHLHAMGQVRLDSWSRGRVVLLGDAGYCPTPLTGLGTSLALVGAYVLAGELARAGDHTRAFAEYERVLRPYVTQGQELPGLGVDGYAPRTALRIRMLQSSMRWATRWPMRPIMDKAFAKADAIDLPDYGRVVRGSNGH